MTTTARQRLADQQASLVRALTGAAAVPAGFDRERVERAARALVNKRLVEVARVWPNLVAALKETYAERFRAFAKQNPPPERGGPLADGRAFAETLSAHEWTDAAAWERIGVDLHNWRDGHGLHRRAGFGLVWERLPQSRRWVVRLRWPGGAVHVLWG